MPATTNQRFFLNPTTATTRNKPATRDSIVSGCMELPITGAVAVKSSQQREGAHHCRQDHSNQIFHTFPPSRCAGEPNRGALTASASSGFTSRYLTCLDESEIFSG